MKLGYVINAFDASEHLETIIKEIKNELYYVAAIWQKKSYWGNPIAKEDMDELKKLKEEGLIDELIEFKPNFTKYSREQECDKRNMAIDIAKQKGCSHVISADADEYYSLDQFIHAKNMIIKNKWGITYCSYVNYYRDFDHYLVYPFRPGVPFIHSTYFKYTYNGPAPLPTDPTRRINNPTNLGTYIFPDEIIRMGHAAWVRRDIRKKLVNWSAKNHFKKELIEKAVERWENWKGPEEPAIMLFNVPNHNVKVKKLEKKIHNFKVPWLPNGKWEYKKI